MTKSVAFYTLGCKVNQYETGRMEQQFREAGYEVLDPTRFASVYVINTCTVTRLAERKSRQFLRRARRQNPDAILAVVGCYPTVNPDEVRGIGDIDIVLDNDRKEQIVECVEACEEERSAQRIRSSCEDSGSFDAAVSPGNLSGQRTRATIKIQDGCDRFCTYCVIPYARGHIRSRPLEDIVTESERLIEGGARELVLAGINTALYGAEKGAEATVSSTSCAPSAVCRAIFASAWVRWNRRSSMRPTSNGCWPAKSSVTICTCRFKAAATGY